jgi:hypothetical protein
MKSFVPGQLIHNKSTPIPVLVVSVKPVIPPCNPGAIITVLPLGENKPSGPIFAVPSHWELLLKDPR